MDKEKVMDFLGDYTEVCKRHMMYIEKHEGSPTGFFIQESKKASKIDIHVGSIILDVFTSPEI